MHTRTTETDTKTDTKTAAPRRRGTAGLAVAFFVSSFPELSETFILNQITGLIRLGHTVDIFTSRMNSRSVRHPDVEGFRLIDRTIVYGHTADLVPKGKIGRIIGAVRLFAAAPPGYRRPLARALDVFRYGRMALSLNLFYRTYITLQAGRRYDIVQCHFGENGVTAAQLMDVGALSGKLVTTFHGYDLSSYVRAHGTNVYDFLFRKGDLFLPISERWREKLIALGCPPEKIGVHRMGIELARFPFRPRGPREDGMVRLLSVARLVEKKGIRYAVEAVARLLGKYPGVEYDIAGDGPLKEALADQIERHGIAGKVRLLGWKNQTDITALMRQADILLCPSVTDRNGDQEGIPVVLMEALAQGLPVVGTRHSGIPELVRDGESGFLVPERDAESLADRLEYLITHPARWADMGGKGRRFVERFYDVDSLNVRLVGRYRSLCGM